MSTYPKDGGPAFPAEQGHCPDGTWNQTFEYGMSLRDYFAGQALAGMLAGHFADTVPHDDVSNGTSSSPAACFAYLYADAMLAAREVQS